MSKPLEEDERLFCTFLIDNNLFGIEVHRVQEVISYQKITNVPLASSSIKGLMNLRGQIVTAIDLRERLGFVAFTEDQEPMNVVLKNAVGGTVSLLVDEVGDVLPVDENTFEPPPDTLDGSLKRLIYGVYKMSNNALLLVLDTNKAIADESSFDSAA